MKDAVPMHSAHSGLAWRAAAGSSVGGVTGALAAHPHPITRSCESSINPEGASFFPEGKVVITQ